MNLRQAIDTYRGHTIPHVRWVEHRNRWFAISGVLILVSRSAGCSSGSLNFSIDFEGGARITYTFADAGQPPRRFRRRSSEHGIDDAEVQIVNGEAISIRTPSLTGEGVSGVGGDPPRTSPSRPASIPST